METTPQLSLVPGKQTSLPSFSPISSPLSLEREKYQTSRDAEIYPWYKFSLRVANLVSGEAEIFNVERIIARRQTEIIVYIIRYFWIIFGYREYLLTMISKSLKRFDSFRHDERSIVCFHVGFMLLTFPPIFSSQTEAQIFF